MNYDCNLIMTELIPNPNPGFYGSIDFSKISLIGEWRWGCFHLMDKRNAVSSIYLLSTSEHLAYI